MTSKLKVNLINDSGDNNIITSDGSGNLTTQKILQPNFSVKLTSNQSVSASTLTTLQFNSEQWDSDGKFDTSTYRFTPTIAGKYCISFTIMMQNIATAGNRIQYSLYKNGAFYADVGDWQPSTGSGADPAATLSLLIDFNTTDYVYVTAYHDSGTGAKDISSDYSFFQGFRIGT